MSKIKEWCQSLVDSGIIPQLPANIDCATYEQYAKYLESENAELRERLDKVVELPCKVGDKIYKTTEFIPLFSKNCLWTVLDFEIVKIEIYQGEILFYDDSDNEIRLEDFGKTVFLTEEAAESRLAELKGDK